MNEKRKVLKRFVAFEGIDGSGTTTQLARLGAWLESRGVPHWETCEPTDSAIGTLIRKALSGSEPLHAATVARLFAADRGEHLFGDGGIVETLDAGRLVVCDRYLFSSLAYQGLTCGPELPRSLNDPFPLPELLLMFTIPPEIAAERLKARKSLDIYENIAFQTHVAASYARAIDEFGGLGMKIVYVDASAPEDQVERSVREAVAPLFEAF